MDSRASAASVGLQVLALFAVLPFLLFFPVPTVVGELAFLSPLAVLGILAFARWWAEIFAIVASSVLASALLVPLLLLSELSEPAARLSAAEIALALVLFALVWACAYLTVGIPSHCLLAWRELREAHHYIATGAAVGGLVAVGYLALFWSAPRAELDQSVIGVTKNIGLFVAYGAGASSLFWFAAVRSKQGNAV